MKEYTLFAVISVFITVFLDNRSGVRLLRKGLYYVFLLIISFFFFLVNSYLTSKPIVIYNPAFFAGIRIGTIPAEDFLFNFSMVTMTIIFWEFFRNKTKRVNKT